MLRSGLMFAVVMTAVCASHCEAGWPFEAEGPRRGSAEYYEMHADAPVGQRQKYRFGKLWPPFARPTGPKAPLVHRYHHNTYWPLPYIEDDRQSVQTIVDTQIQNGWEESMTLYDYHFDRETNELNAPGRDHLYWIMSDVPVETRQVLVATSRVDPNANNLRVNAVHEELSRIGGAQAMIPVGLRVATPHGSPASYVNSIFKYRVENMTPPPTITYTVGGQ
ncbi:MAG: hypothetical protein R3C01_03030 [Planctomycetaceae bacterium]